MATINLNFWKKVQKLDDHFKLNIKQICVFGETSDQFIFLTNYDYVFVFGSNKNGCLGTGNTNSVDKLMIVPELCNKKITEIYYGSDFMVALTKNGEIYTWGNNEEGQLGNGSKINIYKPLLLDTLSTEFIETISCGRKNCLALTKSGSAYSFGYNFSGQTGLNSPEDSIFKPRKINHIENVIAISCGSDHSMLLTKNRKVYSWGYNNFGQLGVGDCAKRRFPVNITHRFESAVYMIACGKDHSLVLTFNSIIYAFGDNSFGQIGNNSKRQQNIPVKLTINDAFTEIGTNFTSDISITKSTTGICYVWGETHCEVLLTPIKSNFEAIKSAFVFYSKMRISLNSMNLDNTIKTNILKNKMIEALDNPYFSREFKLIIENNIIYVNRSLLEFRCKLFNSMISNKVLEVNFETPEDIVNEIVLTDHSYTAYKAFISYILTDSLELNQRDVYSLIDMSNSYCEEHLKFICIDIIKTEISIPNACKLYSLALNYKLENFEKFCFKFLSGKLNDICSTDAFKQMNTKYIVKLIEKAALNKLFKDNSNVTDGEEFHLNNFNPGMVQHGLDSFAFRFASKFFKWRSSNTTVNHSARSTLAEQISDKKSNKISRNKNLDANALKKLKASFDNPDLCDLRFKVENKFIYVNKEVLKIFSDHFRSMFSENWSEGQENEIEINGYSYDLYYNFLNFLYTDKLNIDFSTAFEMYDLANSYFESELKEQCLLIIKSGISFDTACMIFSFSKKYKLCDIEDFAYLFMVNKFNDICLTESFKTMDKICLVDLIIRAAKQEQFKVSENSITLDDVC